MRKLLKKLTHPFLKLLYKKRFSKPRKYTYESIEVLVLPEVFPPNFTFSTKILLTFIKSLNLKDKTVLELGCGSGIIALYASSKGANVTATDINKIALKALGDASNKNNLKVSIVHSDLFSNIKKTPFDNVFINPPYYPKDAKNIKEKAWFCGENFEYFEKLFQQLSHRKDNNVFIILSEDCDIEKIYNIAFKHNIKLNCILEKKVMFEKNFIYNVDSIKKPL